MSAREAVAREPASLQRPASHWLGRGGDRMARWLVLRLLARTRGGELELIEEHTRVHLGELIDERPLRAVVHVRSLRFYRQLLRGSIGLCESYMDGLWECDDLVALTRIAALNVGALDRLRRVLAPVLIPLQRWARWLARSAPLPSCISSHGAAELLVYC